MSEPRRLVMRLLSFLRANRAERELDREMTAHLRQLEEDFARKGTNADEARLAARRAFGGGVEQAKEVQRDARSIRWLDELRQNVRYALARCSARLASHSSPSSPSPSASAPTPSCSAS